jgi:hypothetical protein
MKAFLRTSPDHESADDVELDIRDDSDISTGATIEGTIVYCSSKEANLRAAYDQLDVRSGNPADQAAVTVLEPRDLNKKHAVGTVVKLKVT